MRHTKVKDIDLKHVKYICLSVLAYRFFYYILILIQQLIKSFCCHISAGGIR